MRAGEFRLLSIKINDKINDQIARPKAAAFSSRGPLKGKHGRAAEAGTGAIRLFYGPAAGKLKGMQERERSE